jgi:hypothetical protein
LVGGKKILLLNNMEPSTKQTFSWLIKGKGKITIDAGCPTAGTKNIDISL